MLKNRNNRAFLLLILVAITLFLFQNYNTTQLTDITDNPTPMTTNEPESITESAPASMTESTPNIPISASR